MNTPEDKNDKDELVNHFIHIHSGNTNSGTVVDDSEVKVRPWDEVYREMQKNFDQQIRDMDARYSKDISELQYLLEVESNKLKDAVLSHEEEIDRMQKQSIHQDKVIREKEIDNVQQRLNLNQEIKELKEVVIVLSKNLIGDK